MGKQAISVTLDAENVMWLRGRAAATGARGVSELVDRLVTGARGAGGAGTSRSVMGTIDIDRHDPLLAGADAIIRQLYDRSLARPLIVRERSRGYGSAARSRPRAKRRKTRG